MKSCIIYNTPINSKYYNPNVFEDTGLDILDICGNARVSKIIDYTIANNEEIKTFLFEENHPKINRNNCDLHLTKKVTN